MVRSQTPWDWQPLTHDLFALPKTTSQLTIKECEQILISSFLFFEPYSNIRVSHVSRTGLRYGVCLGWNFLNNTAGWCAMSYGKGTTVRKRLSLPIWACCASPISRRSWLCTVEQAHTIGWKGLTRQMDDFLCQGIPLHDESRASRSSATTTLAASRYLQPQAMDDCWWSRWLWSTLRWGCRCLTPDYAAWFSSYRDSSPWSRLEASWADPSFISISRYHHIHLCCLEKSGSPTRRAIL